MNSFFLSLSLILVLSLNSCGSKKENSQEAQSENIKHLIISALNQENAELAFQLSRQGQSQHPDDKEFLYYEAQALSLKASIDIYTLFPLVKMQLFDIAISEWQEASKFEDRRRQSTNLILLGEGELDERYKKADLILAQIDKLEKMNKEQKEEVKAEYEILNRFSYGDGSDYNPFTCSITYSAKNEFTPKGREYKGYLYRRSEVDCNETNDEELIAIVQKHFPKEQLFKYTLFMLNERADKFIERKNQERFVKAGFALFEGLPILKKIPSISAHELGFLKHSLEKLDSIRSLNDLSPRIKDNTLKQIGLMGAYLITYSISSSVDLDQINEPIDFACKINSAKFVENYHHLKLGFKSLLSVSLETEFYKKNKKNMDMVKEHMDKAPDNLTDEQKAEYIDDIEKLKEDNC